MQGDGIDASNFHSDLRSIDANEISLESRQLRFSRSANARSDRSLVAQAETRRNRGKRALLEGHELEVWRLVSEGAEDRAWAEWLGTPLLHAAIQGNVEAVKKLLRAGATPNARDTQKGSKRKSALQLAVANGHDQVVRALLMAGADVNAVDKVGETSLHEAVRANQPGMINDLLLGGALPDVCSLDGSTPLQLAAASGQEGSVTALLLKGADTDFVGNTGPKLTPLHEAVSSGHYGVVELLLGAGASPILRPLPHSKNALDEAAERGRADIVRVMLDHGGSARAANSKGWTALHWLAYTGGRTPTHMGDALDFLGTVRALVEAGADVEAKTVDDGLTPLHCATISPEWENMPQRLDEPRPRGDLLTEDDLPTLVNVGAAHALLQHGARVDSLMKDGYTALHFACANSNVELAELLLKFEAAESMHNEDVNTVVNLVLQERVSVRRIVQ